MSASFLAAAAQLGPVQFTPDRSDVLTRMRNLMHQAAAHDVRLLVFPELALTPFFPHEILSVEEATQFFEPPINGEALAYLRREAARLGLSVAVGFGEATLEGARYNSMELISSSGTMIGKYRKIHLPGAGDPTPGAPFQNLEPRYFQRGDLGFPTWRTLGTQVGMLICNDRRWAESYRALALGGAEVALIGYTTPRHAPHFPALDRLVDEHNELSMRAGAYQNYMWVIAAARAGVEKGVDHIAGSCIISPAGEVVARASTNGDELVVARVDPDESSHYRSKTNFFAAREPAAYSIITTPKGSTPAG